MSKRHQELKPLRPPKPIRQKANRKLRHSVAQDLHTAGDPESVVLSEPVVEHISSPPPQKTKRRRHWKMKDWKRRTNLRRERNAELTRLVHADE